MRAVVDHSGLDRCAASTSQMGRCETALLTSEANLAVLTDLSGAWIDRAKERRPQTIIVLDMDSSPSAETVQDIARRAKRCLSPTKDRKGGWSSGKCWFNCVTYLGTGDGGPTTQKRRAHRIICSYNHAARRATNGGPRAHREGEPESCPISRRRPLANLPHL
jgi:hypothetical protein